MVKIGNKPCFTYRKKAQCALEALVITGNLSCGSPEESEIPMAKELHNYPKNHIQSITCNIVAIVIFFRLRIQSIFPRQSCIRSNATVALILSQLSFPLFSTDLENSLSANTFLTRLLISSMSFSNIPGSSRI